MRVLKILIITALLLLPLGELLRFDAPNNIPIKALDLVVGLSAAWWIGLNLFNKKKVELKNILKNKLHLAISVFFAIAFLSLLINSFWLKPNDFFVSHLYLVRWLSYILFLPIVLQMDKQFKKKIIFVLLIDGIAFLVFGIIQYFFYNSLKNLYYLGWDEHLHRIFSTFLDPNFAGAFYVLFFIFVSGLLISYRQKKKHKQSIFLSVLLLITLIAVFLTFSRAAILMLIIGAFTFLTLINKKKLIGFILLAIVLFIVIASPKFNDENMNLFREASSKARIDNYALALKITKDQPILGVGFNTYRYAKLKYGIRERVDMPSHADAGVDNSFLFVLVTTGVIGLAAYLWLWKEILVKAIYLHKKKYIYGTVIISSVFALSVDALFINSLFYAPLMFWMWVLIGIADTN